MPLLHMAGITGSRKTFSLAFCLLAKETQQYYKWALDFLLTIFNTNKTPLPNLFLTNQEQALMHSLTFVFPQAIHLLCMWHIQKNLLTNAAKLIQDKVK